MRIDLRVGISISSFVDLWRLSSTRVRHSIMFSPYSLPRNVLSLRFLRAQTHRPLELASKNARRVTGWRPYSSFPDIPGHGAGRDRAAVGVHFIFLFHLSFVLISSLEFRYSHQKPLHCSLHPALAYISTSATRKSSCSCNVVCPSAPLLSCSF